MADQNHDPAPWKDSMSDGCSGVPDWYPLIGSLLRPCINHDRAYHYGGTHEANRLDADQMFREETHEIAQKLTGWRKWILGPLVHGLAEVRYRGVRAFGKGSFNWAGPGLPEDVEHA